MKRTIFRALFAALAPMAVFAQSGPGTVSIGIAPSLTKELSDAQQKFIEAEFPTLVKDFTGLSGVVAKPATVDALADNLAEGTNDFGVFQGIEFAEALARHPELQPLLLSIYRTPEVKAVLAVKKDGDVSSFADLKGKTVSILKEGKEHIRRFARKEAAGDPAKFFGAVDTPVNAEAALDAILLDKAQGALVDSASLDIYKEVNPGKFRRLKIVAESAVFPPSVIAYNPKKLSEATMRQFRDGMLKAEQSNRGREVMSTFKITSFAPVPAGFEKTLPAIRDAYPGK